MVGDHASLFIGMIRELLVWIVTPLIDDAKEMKENLSEELKYDTQLNNPF